VSRQAPDITTAIEWAKRGQDSMTKCPAHEDGTASLHVSPGSDGQPVVLRCHATCENADVIAAAGIDWEVICGERVTTFQPENEWTPSGNASHVYSYTDAEGTELFQALRVPQPNGKKTFFQRRWDSDTNRWAWNLNGVQRVLYRLPAVLRGVRDGQTIYIFEGEKDAEAAVMDGYCATTSPMGAGKWQPEYAESLRGANVVIVADNDPVGQEHARDVFTSLEAVECNVQIAETMMPGCKDYYDHRVAGGTMATMVVTAESTRARETRPAYTLGAMIETDFTAGREIIPGHFAEANICLLVGPEGFGKSLFMRQMAVMCAAGINPFTSADMEPLKVLYIDGENPEHQQKLDWVKLDYLARRHRDETPHRDNLTVIAAWEDAPSLVSPNGEAWFAERIMAHQPDICFLGPVSDLVDGKLSDDDVVRRFKRTLYKTRAICGTAYVIEHHSPHRMAGDKTREMRPYGSSVFRRFPDFGYGLQPKQDEGKFELVPFRGARVRSRAWPTDLRWGTPGPQSMEWPWEFEADVAGSVTVGKFGA
jgi:hypothetical protein